jgi:hypothetical protein
MHARHIHARHRRTLWRGTLLSALALALLPALAPAGPTQSTAAAAPLAVQPGPRLVLAFYYTWFMPADFENGRMLDRPAAPYNSSQPETMDRQVREARDAGIDAFIAAWTGEGTDTDANFGRLLDIAHKRGFSATIYFETNSAVHHGDIAAQIQSVMSRYGSHPAFLRWNGKPVLFFWSPQTVGNAGAWAGIRAKVDPGWGQVWSVDTTDAGYLDAFDTIHFFSGGKWRGDTNVAAVNAQWRGRVDDYNKRKGTGRLWTAGVIPGWDESRVQPPRPQAKVFPRRDGAMYEEGWRGAVASNPEWITITSFNEWYEGTQIEPAASYGTRYLDITRQYANEWKHGPNPCSGGTRFGETGKSICRPMEAYWRNYGGVQQFGFPISEAVSEPNEVDGKTYLVQYFERARFELHPENAGTQYEVLLGQLGLQEYKRLYPEGAPGQKANNEAAQFFPETGKWLGGAFRQRWLATGGVFVNGFPISDEMQERAEDGKTYWVQYFERARFEFHPENPAPYNVLLSLLGRRAFDSR